MLTSIWLPHEDSVKIRAPLEGGTGCDRSLQKPGHNMENIAEYSALSIALLVIYGLVDKFVFPKIHKSNGGANSNDGNGNVRYAEIERRIRTIEDDLRQYRKQLSAVTGEVADVRSLSQVASAILKRVENQVNENDRKRRNKDTIG